jgi:hypothetical protein
MGLSRGPHQDATGSVQEPLASAISVRRNGSSQGPHPDEHHRGSVKGPPMLRQSVGPSRGPSAQVSSSQPMGLSRSTTKTPVDPSRDVSPQPFRCVAVGRPMDPIQKSMTKGLSRDPPMLREATGPARGPSAHVSSSQPMGLSRGPTKTLMQSKRKPSPCTRLRLCHYCTCAVASAGLKNALVLPLCGRGPVQQSADVRTEHPCTQSSRAQEILSRERNAQYPRPCCGPPRRQTNNS